MDNIKASAAFGTLNPSLKMNAFYSWFNIAHISSRFRLIILLFVVVVTLFSVLVYMQNSKSQTALSTIESVRLPIPLAAGNLIGGIDRVASLQRAYMLSGNAEYNQERLLVYEQQIYPAVEILTKVKFNLSETEQANIVEIEKKTDEFYTIQEDILSFFEKTRLPVMQVINRAADENTLEEVTHLFLDRQKGEQEIKSRIQQADAIRAQLLDLVTPLKQTQDQKLKDDIIQVNKGVTRGNVIIIAISIVSMLVLMVLAYFTIRSLKKSIQTPVDLINGLAAGKLPDHIGRSRDELNEILLAGAKLVNNLKSASHFAL
jgi:CHASE3 domain sensor protein